VIFTFLVSSLLISCSFPGPSIKNQESYAPCLYTKASYTPKDLQWLNEKIIPYNISTLSEKGLPIKELVYAEITGLGESTHGSHEIYETKIEFTNYLIQDLAYRLVAIEIPYPYISKLNEYIYGNGDELEHILRHTGAWIIHTDEMFNFIQWLKGYNTHVSDNNKVTIIGFDIPIDDAQSGIDTMTNYLGKVDTENSNKLINQLACIAIEPFLYRQLSTVEKEGCRAGINDLINTLEENRATYISLSSLDQFELAVFQANLLLQHEEFLNSSDEVAYSHRDRFMKENVVWIHNVLGRNEKKIVLWAHNAHIGRNTYGKTNSGTMGFLLNDYFGDKYFPIGSTFWEGEFNAIPLTTSHKADSPPADSYEAFFHSANTTLFFIQINQISTPKWFAENHCLRSIGAIYDLNKPEYGWDVDKLSGEYDGFFFVNTSSPTSFLE
jgi:erythromycin esterase